MMPELERLGSIPSAIVGVALLWAASWGIGGILVNSKTVFCRAIDALVLRFVVGLNLVALAGCVLGFFGLLTDSRTIALLLFLAFLSLRSPDSNCHQRGQKTDTANRFAWRRSPLCGLVVLAIAVLTLGPALAYPTGWDELVYHMVLPRRWHADGWLAFYPDLPYSGFPSLSEILFWLMAPLECLIAPRLLVWSCWTLALVALYRLLRRTLCGSAALQLSVVFALSPATLMISANCYVESIQLLNVAALLLAVGARQRFGTLISGRAPPTVVGVLAGGAAAVKLTGLSVLVLPVLWYIGAAWIDRARRRKTVRRSVASFAVSLGICLPFYGRAWWLTGNPFYPYFADWFSNNAARNALSRYHHMIGDSPFGVRTVAAFFESPLLLAFNDPLYDGSFGWQLLVIFGLALFAIVMLVRRRMCRIVAWPALVASVFYVFWYLTSQQARFAVPAVFAGMLVAGFGIRRLRGLLRRFAFLLLIATAVVSFPWRTTGYYLGSWETVFGFWTWTEYVDDGTDAKYMPLIRALRELTPEDATLVMIFEHRGLYLPRTHILGTPFFQETIFSQPHDFAAAEPIMSTLRRHGITHVVMAKSAIGPDPGIEWQQRLGPFIRGIQDCLEQERLRVVFDSVDYIILAVQ